MASLRTEISEIKQKLGGIQRVVADLTGLEEEVRDNLIDNFIEPNEFLDFA